MSRATISVRYFFSPFCLSLRIVVTIWHTHSQINRSLLVAELGVDPRILPTDHRKRYGKVFIANVSVPWLVPLVCGGQMLWV